MRILVFASCVWNYYQRLTPLCGELAQRGVEVIFLEPLVYSGADALHLTAEKPIPVPAGVRVVRRQTRLRRGVGLVMHQNLVNLSDLLHWKPDAVVLCDSTFTILPALVARLGGTRVLLDYIDDWPEWSQVRWERWMLRHVFIPWSARMAHVCIVTAELLGRDLEGAARKVVWIPNGAAAMPDPLTPELLREGRGALFVGGLAERIDLDWLITLAREAPEVEISILGGGPLLLKMQEAAKSIGNLRVRGPVPHEEAIAAMKAAAVCLIPYRRNRLTDRCFPIKLAEYWAYGKPVIATPCHEMRRVGGEIVQWADTGKEAAARVRNLLTDVQKREHLGRAGHALARRYNYEVLAEEFLQTALPHRQTNLPNKD